MQQVTRDGGRGQRQPKWAQVIHSVLREMTAQATSSEGRSLTLNYVRVPICSLSVPVAPTVGLELRTPTRTGQLGTRGLWAPSIAGCSLTMTTGFHGPEFVWNPHMGKNEWTSVSLKGDRKINTGWPPFYSTIKKPAVF